MKQRLLRSPTTSDLTGLLSAWRVWLALALLGGLSGWVAYALVPPNYRASAVVLVDFNYEEIYTEESQDRDMFYYMQEESDKLMEIAWSDQVMATVAAHSDLPVEVLRSETLQISQPGDGGWDFLANSTDPESASDLAGLWARTFYEVVSSGPIGVAPTTDILLVVGDEPPVQRIPAPGVLIFGGSLLGVAVGGLALLFFGWKEKA